MPGKVRGVRGSPLLRFIILVFALAATGIGLMRVTSAKPTENQAVPVKDPEKQPLSAVPFRLQLSAAAEVVEIDTGRVIRPPVGASLVSGMLELDPGNPRVSLIVRWKNGAAAGEHRFAKLTLEAPGQPTFTHVFDADGNIDEFLELPFPVEK
jgi:hypothetical protein